MFDMEKSHVNLSLARQDFRIVCAESPEYMKALEAAVNERIDGIRRKYPSMSTMRIVLLAMLNMEDDLFKAGLDRAADEGDPQEGEAQSGAKSEEDDF